MNSLKQMRSMAKPISIDEAKAKRAKKLAHEAKVVSISKEVDAKRKEKKERDRQHRHSIRKQKLLEIKRIKAEKAALEQKQEDDSIHNVEMLANHAAAGESILKG